MSLINIKNKATTGLIAVPLAMSLVNCAATSANIKRSQTQGRYRVESGPISADAFNKGLQAGEVSETFSEHLNKILRCYDRKTARKHPKGTVDLRFFVEATGSVSEAKASGLSDKVEECVQEVVSTVSFPSSKNGEPVSVYVPVTFSRAAR